MNLSYWGFNQYIIQRALAAKNLDEAQKGVDVRRVPEAADAGHHRVAGYRRGGARAGSRRARRGLSDDDGAAATGILGLVFAALVAAIVASRLRRSIRSRRSSRWTSTQAARRKDEKHWCGSAASPRSSILLAILTARPLLGSFDQAFQYIQEYTGFFTPGIVVIFVLGLFWKRARSRRAGRGDRIVRAVGRVEDAVAGLPFMDRMGVVFLLALLLAVRNAKRLDRLASDILDVTKRIESNSLKLEKTYFNLNDILSNSIRDIQNQVSSGDIGTKNLKIVYDPVNIRISGDKERINQVISNLLSNGF